MPNTAPQLESVGAEMHSLISRLFPICRSMTGEGVRETLRIVQEHVPLTIQEIPTGTQAFDWEVPQEWTIRGAYIKDAGGNRIIDFCDSNLHVVSGSHGVDTTMRWSDLKNNIHTLPDYPDWIPYRTCFHQSGWGFCMSHRQFAEIDAIGDLEYQVCIDATLTDGSLTYGELFLPGTTDDEILLSCHVCHPSLANDNLSGITVATHLAKHLSQRERRLGVRFDFAPATIGAITWLSQNEHRLPNIKHGLVLSLLGDSGCSTYKKTRRGDADIDRAAAHVLKHSGSDYSIIDFEPIGYDERQFGSPGIDLSVGCLMRTPNGQYPEYHTSADNLELVHPEYLADSLDKLRDIVEVLDGNEHFINEKPKCEPRLGKHGLYQAFGGDSDQAEMQRAVLWVLNCSDGEHSLLGIAQRSGIPFSLLRRAADALLDAGLLSRRDHQSSRSPAVNVASVSPISCNSLPDSKVPSASSFAN